MSRSPDESPLPSSFGFADLMDELVSFVRDGAWMLSGRRGSRPSSPSPTDALRTLTDLHLAGKRPLVRRPELELREMSLREPCGRWAVGTLGVIVDAFEDEATVEILDPEGRTLDLLSLGYDRFVVLDSTPQESLPLDA